MHAINGASHSKYFQEYTERTLNTNFRRLLHWKKYVDDTHAHNKPNKADGIIKALSNYHPKIQFKTKQNVLSGCFNYKIK